MSKRWTSLMRKVAPILGAGYLLQANGCTLLDPAVFDPALVGQQLVTAVVNSVITSFVFSLLGVGI